MATRKFSYHKTLVTGGPGLGLVSVDIKYLDPDDSVIGEYGETLIGFATTWKDVAEAVRTGLRSLGLDDDPVRHVSPMVDLT